MVSDVPIHVVRKQLGLLPSDLSCLERLRLLATLRAAMGSGLSSPVL